MAKNDFDIDFDFEKEYGFDPKASLDSDYSDEDLDLSQFDDAALGIDLERETESEFDDFDLDGLDLGEEEDSSFAEEPVVPVAEPAGAQEDDLDLDDLDLDGLDFEDDDDEEEDYPDDADLTADMAFTRRANFFGMDTGKVPQQEVYQEPVNQEPSYEEPAYQEPSYEEPAYQEEAVQEAEEQYEEPVREQEEPAARRRRERPRKEKQPVKLTVPPVLTNLVHLYFPTQQEIHARMEAGDGRRRRKPTKQQIFKEFYLPTIIAGLSVVLILSFVIGALSNAIDSAQQKRLEEQQKAQQESIAAEQLATEGVKLLQEAEILAKSYNYDGAIEILDSYACEQSQEMIAKRAEYINAKSTLVEHQDPTLIPNLSFHVLVADMARAMADDDDLAGQYNRNFVSTAEFEKILDQLYLNNFVLVNFENFVGSGSVDGTTEMYDEMSIWLPEGKKPVMITETMVNYFTYMIDGNDDGVADSGGDGFASRIVIGEDGYPTCEYMDANGNVTTGDYDLVPILERFIQEHPDFSYHGARAILGMTGYEGVFGYRTKPSYETALGTEAYQKEVEQAKEVAQCLRDHGWILASHSYGHPAYGNITADKVETDSDKWENTVQTIIGETDVILYPHGSDIAGTEDYSFNNAKFAALYEDGYRYFFNVDSSEYWCQLGANYYRAARRNLNGYRMYYNPNRLDDLFDVDAVFDPDRPLPVPKI